MRLPGRDDDSAEVYEKNPWMCYGTAMHRLREWGSPQKVGLKLSFEELEAVNDCFS